MIVIKTERLFISEITSADSDFMFRLLNSPKWLQFIGNRNIQTIEDATHYIEHIIRPSYEKYGFGYYKICLNKSDAAVGICGLIKRDFLDDIDIGYALLPEYEGKGFALEATQALFGYAESKLGLSNILAFTTPDNERSIHLLEKLGFSFVKSFLYPDTDEELNLYASRV